MCNAKVGKRYYVIGDEKNYVGRMVIGRLNSRLIVIKSECYWIDVKMFNIDVDRMKRV